MMDYRAIVPRLQGPLAPILTAFDEDDALNIDATCQWVDWMINKGIGMFWTTAGTSHYMCLTDAEIVDLNKALAATIGDRAIFIASTPWQWPVHAIRQFVDDAAGWGGVDIVKVQLEWMWKPSDAQVIERYAAVADDSSLPLFAYALPAGQANVDLLHAIMDMPAFVGEKNDIDDFAGQEYFLQAIESRGLTGQFVAMTGGGLNSVMYGWELGVRAYGDIFTWFAPEHSLAFYEMLRADRRDEAWRFIAEWERPLRHQLETLGVRLWSWGHTVLKLIGQFPAAYT